MTITVGELCRLPHLRCDVLAGAGGLERAVAWVHTSDLPNAWEWHGAGELLLTNGTGLPADGAGQAEFANRLAACGASGFALGLGMTGPPLTPDLIRRCDELDLPLLTVPFSVPFTAVVRAVADANDREESRQLLTVARLYELLRQSLPVGDAGPGLLERLGQELGVQLLLVDPASGRSLEDGSSNPYSDSVASGFAAHGYALPGMLPLAAPHVGGKAAVAVAVPAESPAALVVVPSDGELPSTVLLQHAAAAGALQLAQLVARRERDRRAAADLFAQLLDRRLTESTADVELAAFGLGLDDLVVVAVRPDVAEVRPDVAPDLVRMQVPHLALWRPPQLLLLIPESALRVADGAPALRRFPNFGTSSPLITASRVPEAVGEAVWALAAAETDQLRSVRFGDASLLLPRTSAEARGVAERVLGPLIAHDSENGTPLLETLRAMLDHDRSWQAAAAALHIHKQTLGYRLRRIEALTGRGFSRTEHIAEWWIALRAHDLLRGAAEVGAGRSETLR